MSEEKVIMPKELTAENGAKGAMIGEYHFNFGVYVDEFGDEHEETVTVPWTTIKQIYKDAVKMFGEPYGEN